MGCWYLMINTNFEKVIHRLFWGHPEDTNILRAKQSARQALYFVSHHFLVARPNQPTSKCGGKRADSNLESDRPGKNWNQTDDGAKSGEIKGFHRDWGDLWVQTWLGKGSMGWTEEVVFCKKGEISTCPVRDGDRHRQGSCLAGLTYWERRACATNILTCQYFAIFNKWNTMNNTKTTYSINPSLKLFFPETKKEHCLGCHTIALLGSVARESNNFSLFRFKGWFIAFEPYIWILVSGQSAWKGILCSSRRRKKALWMTLSGKGESGWNVWSRSDWTI